MNVLEEEVEKYKKIHSGQSKVVVDNGTTKSFENGDHFADGEISTRIGLPHMLLLQKEKRRAISILDYGCGKATHTYKRDTKLTSKLWTDRTIFEILEGNIQCYYCFDPAVDRYSVKPSQGSLFDYVQMIDVGEHIPEPFVEGVVKEALSYVKQDGLFVISVSSVPSFHYYSEDGQGLGNNLHITLKSMDWWFDLVKQLSDGKAFALYCQQPHKTQPKRIITASTYHDSALLKVEKPHPESLFKYGNKKR